MTALYIYWSFISFILAYGTLKFAKENPGEPVISDILVVWSISCIIPSLLALLFVN